MLSNAFPIVSRGGPAAALGLLLACASLILADEPKTTEKPPEPGAVEVHFSDGSVLKLLLKEESIEVATSAGKKTVKMADVRKIRLTQRLSDDDDKKIKAAITDLGSDVFKTRQRATTDLLRLGIKAYPALVKAKKDGDAETQKRASDVIDTLKQNLPEEMFEAPTEDVVWTKDGKVAGKIGQASWKANTTQFGDVQVKLGDVVRVHAVGFPDPEGEKLTAEADPGSVEHLAGMVGKTYAFKVTGTNNGSVWGSGTYTSDSTIAMAAVHAGLVKVGETKVLKVKIVAPLNAYTGSTKNDITTSGYGPWGGAYEFTK